MNNLRPRSFTLLLTTMLVMLFVTTGCWQPANDSPTLEVAESRPLPTPTPMPSPTPTDSPTPEPVTETPTPEEIEAGAQAVETEVTEVAQVDPTEDPGLDPGFIIATNEIQTATQQVIDVTLTFEAIFATPTDTATLAVTLTPTPSPTQEFGQVPGGSCVHYVRTGDNLFRLSLAYNVPIRDIQTANGIANPNLIIACDDLIIPNCATSNSPTPPSYCPATNNPGDPQPNPVPGGSAGGITHLVEQGETLYQISLRYNVPIRTIMAANPAITNPNLIFFAQELIIP